MSNNESSAMAIGTAVHATLLDGAGDAATNKAAAIWLQNDAEFLYRCAAAYRSEGNEWMASQVQENAAYSAKLARERMGLEAAGSAS